MSNIKQNSFSISLRHHRQGWWSQHLKPWWQDHHWIVAGLLAGLTLVLGLCGFRDYYPTRPFLHIFYLTLQLFVLESGAVTGSTTWPLEVARLLAPALAAYAAVKTLAAIFSEQVQLFRLRFFKNHVVICGLGRKGSLLASTLQAQGYRVVVIEKNASNEHLAHCREQGIRVLPGNATDEAVLRKARTPRAAYLICLCGEDGVNVEIAEYARELVRQRQGRALLCRAHILDLDLWYSLKGKEITAPAHHSFALEFFNVFERGARAMLDAYPAFEKNQSNASAHLLIVGLGRMGESLLVRAAIDWRTLHRATRQQLRVTVIDREAKRKAQALQARFPQLEKTCALRILEFDVNAPAFREFIGQQNDFTSIYICLDHEATNLTAAWLLKQTRSGGPINIVVRMQLEKGLARLLQKENVGHIERLYAFGLLAQTCKPDLILGGANEFLSRNIHQEYILKQKERGDTAQTNPAMVPWDELDDSLKASNRDQATHIGVKLKALGCEVTYLTDWDADLFAFTDAEIERLAKMEHERWCAERQRGGWQCAPAPKNIAAKTHPDLVPWEQLAVATKQLDRDTVLNLPAFLAKLGFQIYRLKSQA